MIGKIGAFLNRSNKDSNVSPQNVHLIYGNVGSSSLFVQSLFVVAIMVFLMVIIGGLTRLTGSGLSMVDWKPVTGFIPPLTQADWLREFQNYQQFPEYQKVNIGMTLAEFKSIFWLEFIHRLLGRLIGFALLVPTLIAFLKKDFHRERVYMLLLWVLGAGQGVMGWYMVKSGLIDNPMVSPYRLTAHLLLAFTIGGYVLWRCAIWILGPPLKQMKKTTENKSSVLQKWLLISLIGLGLTICYGALTAGLHAGKVYNTFPQMGEHWFPPELFYQRPLWLNFFEEPVTVQFIHRYLALTTCTFILYTGYKGQKLIPSYSGYFLFLQIAVLIQVLLGVATLLGAVPIHLAVTHQAWAMVVCAGVWWVYLAMRRVSFSVKER